MRWPVVSMSLWLALALVSSAAADAGLVRDRGCTGCHRFSAQEEGKPAPDLFYAGDKFKKSWLERFLHTPEVIRKAGASADPGFLAGKPKAGPHPALSKDEARRMSEYLASLTLPGALPAAIEAAPLSKGQRVKVKILFERNFSCIACHEGINLAGKPRGGVSGPSLANAGHRLRPEWVYAWLTAPETFLKKSRMPKYDLDEETALALTRYIASLQADEVEE